MTDRPNVAARSCRRGEYVVLPAKHRPSRREPAPAGFVIQGSGIWTVKDDGTQMRRGSD